MVDFSTSMNLELEILMVEVMNEGTPNLMLIS